METPDSQSPFDTAWRDATRMLASQDKCESELREKLGHRGHGGDVIDRVVDRLRERNYLDDTRFARDLTERLRRKGYGSERVRADLVRRGLEHEQVAPEVARCVADDDERARAQFERRYPNGAPDRRVRDRAARYLYNRGYPEHVVLAIVGEDW